MTTGPCLLDFHPLAKSNLKSVSSNPLPKSSGHSDTVTPAFYAAANDESAQVPPTLHSMAQGNSFQQLLNVHPVTGNHPTPQPWVLCPGSEGCPGGVFSPPSITGKDRVGRLSTVDGQGKGQEKHSLS